MRTFLFLFIAASTAFADVPVTIVFKKEKPCWAAQKTLRETSFVVECKALSAERFAFDATYLGKAPVGKALAKVAKLKGIESAVVK